MGNKGFFTAQGAALLISTYYFLSCFYAYYFYELAFNRKLKLNEIEPLKKIKPFDFGTSIAIFVTLMTVNIKIYSVFLTKFL